MTLRWSSCVVQGTYSPITHLNLTIMISLLYLVLCIEKVENHRLDRLLVLWVAYKLELGSLCLVLHTLVSLDDDRFLGGVMLEFLCVGAPTCGKHAVSPFCFDIRPICWGHDRGYNMVVAGAVCILAKVINFPRLVLHTVIAFRRWRDVLLKHSHLLLLCDLLLSE